ncbi:MAG TPA: toxin-antitoxin system HicB family antitoxin [Nocardioidaceae bacterium]|jgi:hypothetical protein|nr:toxin-antitoxin system HicB family antitoxin [Nocardioidaceae bacterium]
MDITTYSEGLRRDLVAVAEAGGETVHEAASRLALALDPAVRLALFEALSDAAAEITQQLSPGSVEVRLHGREPQFVVTPPVVAAPSAAATHPDDDPSSDDDGGIARLTLRLPESLKAKAEDAAARRGQSLNTWLTSVIRAATREVAVDVDLDISSFPFPPPSGHRPGRRITGWAR